MKIFLLWTSVFVISIYFTDNVQCNVSDSLLKVVKHSEGEKKVDALNSLAKHLFASSVDSSYMYASQALEQSEKINYLKGQGQSYKYLGIVYYLYAIYDSSVYYSLKGLKIAKELNDLELQASLLSNLGMVFSYTERYDEALKYYYESITVDSIRNDLEGIGSTLMNIGVVYVGQNKYSQAVEYYKRALDVFTQFEALHEMSNVYNNLGLVYDLISDYEKAIHYYLQALKIKEENNDRYGISSIYNNIGTVFQEWGNEKKALEYYYKALKIAEETGHKEGIINAVLNLGYLYDHIGEYDHAMEQYNSINTIDLFDELDLLASLYLDKGITFKNLHMYDSASFYYEKALEIRISFEDKEKTARIYSRIGALMYLQMKYNEAIGYFLKSNDLSNDFENLADNYGYLSEIYEELNKKDKALDYFKLSVAMHDSVFTQEKHRQIYELQIQYETEKKEQQIESLEKINEAKAKQLKLTRLLFGLAIAVVLVVIFSGAMFFHNRQLRAKQRVLISEQRLLRSQMNPHFIFNSLSAIQSYILKNKSSEAGSYLSRFAKLMRSILENSSNEFISLEEEIETLENYLNLQKLRLENKLKFSIKADEKLFEDDISLPPMLSQPFIENAIEHGILKKESAEGIIGIRFVDKKDTICIEITDDGIGRKMAGRIEGKKHRSRATEITESRINLLSKTYKIKPTYTIMDLVDKNNLPAGTKVVIELPKYYKST